MRCSIVLLSTAVTLSLGAGVDARDRTIDRPHVRPLNAVSAALMTDAQQKSATVGELFNKLEASNVVVYVHVAHPAAGSLESGLSFIATSKLARFVLISISSDSTVDRRIELLGHELQHAVEVSGMPWVTNDVQFQRAMRLFGWRDATRARGYETTAASRIESRVRHEVRAVLEPR